jgi:predicted metal-dependent peptidase
MAKSNKSQNKSKNQDLATKYFNQGYHTLWQHPLFSPLICHSDILRSEHNRCPPSAWAVVTNQGQIHIHPTRRGTPENWIYVLAHCLLHLGFEHFQVKNNPIAWNTACNCTNAKFLADLKLGFPPDDYLIPQVWLQSDEEKLYQQLCQREIPFKMTKDLLFEEVKSHYWHQNPIKWQDCLAQGLLNSVTSAINVAGGKEAYLGADHYSQNEAQRAKSWFIAHYPLLGALASSFEIITDPLICQRLEISVAAVDAYSKEIYLNPAAGLSEGEYRFVIAHELLHVGLRHDQRRQGRDAFLWNVACDYVINGWLVDMNIGDLPSMGLLYDPTLKDNSAESIYDLMVTDLRRSRKLATFKGIGQGDLLEGHHPQWWQLGDGLTLDEFYRRCLAQGLLYHQEQERGFLPAGLIEEIKALSQPPIPWDVELAQWFDQYFPPITQIRSYSRPSRRQSSTPDIPRPRYLGDPSQQNGRTFGVILDTSGSMDRQLLAKALGAIASYSVARNVSSVRVVFCDALPYDQGYLSPESISDRLKIKGRGGTVLQPGINLLTQASDFPHDAPLLIITDGWCDRLTIKTEHAFLIPQGHALPFVPKGQVFWLK